MAEFFYIPKQPSTHLVGGNISPELLIEVISPSNTKAEIRDKKKLYFESGASEVWLCDGEGKITFYVADKSTIEKSELFPEFPDSIPRKQTEDQTGNS